MKMTPTRVLVSLALGITLALSACTKKSQDDPNVMTLRKAITDDVKSLDPANAFDSISLDIVPSMYEALYTYDYTSKEYRLIPLLAADFPTYSKDRLTVTIKIRPGVKFTDDAAFEGGKGRELKAADFVYGMKRLAHPGVQSNGTWIYDNRIVGFNELVKKLNETPKDQLAKTFEEAQVEGFKATDDYTLVLKLTKPYPQLMYMLAMSFAAPIPHEAVKKYADERGQINDVAVGTGPFKLEKWQKGHSVTLVRNPTFRQVAMPDNGGPDVGKPLPFLDKVVFSIVKEDQPRWLNFLKGDLDIAGIPKDSFASAISNKTDVADELKKKGIRLDILPGSAFYWVEFNVKDKVLSNKLLRQALSSAINREKWIELFTNNRGTKALTAAPEGLLDRAKPSLKFDYDLARAKDLLKKAGYPEGKGLPTINMDLRGADSTSRQMGEFFTQQFAAINVPVNVIYNTFPAFLEKNKNGALQMSYGGWGLDYPDVENVYQLLYGPNKAPGPNSSMYDVAAFNKLYEQMSVMEPGPARAKVVQQMDDMLQEDTPWALGFYRSDFTMYHGWVMNFHDTAFTRDHYKYIRIDKGIKGQTFSAK